MVLPANTVLWPGFKTDVEAVKTSTDAVKTSVDTVDTDVKAVKTSVDAVNTKLVAGTVIGDVNAAQKGTWTVDVSNFPATQPISGSVSISNFPATQPISAASLPLPTGAATETTLADVKTDLDAIKTAVQGTLNVNTNPVADKVNVIDYHTSASVAAGAVDTHPFTPAVNFALQRVMCAASGQMKMEVQIGTTGSETTKVVKFTSKGDLNAEWVLDEALLVAPTQSVKVMLKNMDNQAMDVYLTIQGVNA